MGHCCGCNINSSFSFLSVWKLETDVVRRGIYRESRLQVDVPRSYSN